MTVMFGDCIARANRCPVKVRGSTMKFRILQWVGLTLILQTGLVHLYLAPESFTEAVYEGLLFVANAIGAVVAAYGIYRGKVWGWNLGILIAAGSIVAYIISRTVGLPGMEIEEWSNSVGVGFVGRRERFPDRRA